MATEVIATVIAAGGGDYTLLSSFESGEQRNLVSADEIAVAECQSGQIDDICTITGWTTDATRRIVIRPASGHEHGGDRTAGFRVTSSTASNGIIRPFEDVTIRGIVLLPTNNSEGVGNNGTAPSLEVDSCVIFGGGSGSSGNGIDCRATVARYFNNIITGFDNASSGGLGIQVVNADTTAHVYNNTVDDCRIGIVRPSAGTLRPKNNIVQNCPGSDFQGTMTDAETNIASDTTGQIQATLDFVDAANGDYHLDPTDTEAIGAGTDLSADANLAFDYDFEGDPRPAGDWDIGADQTAAAGANELSGTPSAQPANASGTMAAVASASGTPSATAATADGAMQHVSPIAGTPQAASATSAGTLQALIQLSGAPTAELATSTGTLAALISMAGAAAAERAASAGTVGVVVSMSGAVQASTAEVFGGRMDDGTGPSPDGFFGSDEWWWI